MNNSYTFKKKGNSKGKIILVILLLIVLMITVALAVLLFNRKEVAAEEVNETQEITGNTELVGYSTLRIDEDNPCLLLENLSVNKTILVYSIEDEKGQSFYESDYLLPGESENVDIFDLFDGGDYTLSYRISIYSFKYELLNDNIRLLQDIEVRKEAE